MIGTRTHTERPVTRDAFELRFGVMFGDPSNWRTMPYDTREAPVSAEQAQAIAEVYDVSRPRCGETTWLEFKRFYLRADRNGFFVVAFDWKVPYLDRAERILSADRPVETPTIEGTVCE